MRRGKTQIFSIFGQIEGVVADAMAEEGLCHRIPRELIPPTARFDEQNRVAHCALVMTPEIEAVFDRRVRELRV